jgi:hypothetical protein
MMGIPPDQARRLTYWEFTAMRHEWNERHKIDGDDGEPVEPPSEDFVRQRQAELAALGISGAGA